MVLIAMSKSPCVGMGLPISHNVKGKKPGAKCKNSSCPLFEKEEEGSEEGRSKALSQ